MCYDMKFKEYEKGIDKVAELDIAEVSKDGTIHYDDVWQQYQVQFSVFSHQGDDDQMALDMRHASGGQVKTLTMRRAVRIDRWMFDKYGIDVIPWEVSMDMENLVNSATGEFSSEDQANFHYRYRKMKAHLSDEPEREPWRFLRLQRPGLYEG